MTLRELAEAATPGPWVVQHPGENEPVYIDTHAYTEGPEPVVPPAGHGYGMTELDAAYIAAVSPDVILRILDRAATLLMKLDRDPSDMTMAEVKTFLASLARGEIGGRTSVGEARMTPIRVEATTGLEPVYAVLQTVADGPPVCADRRRAAHCVPLRPWAQG